MANMKKEKQERKPIPFDEALRRILSAPQGKKRQKAPKKKPGITGT